MQPYKKTCNEPAQEAASGETGVNPDSCMNRSACIYVRAYVCDKLLRVQNTNRACVLSAITELNKKRRNRYDLDVNHTPSS